VDGVVRGIPALGPPDAGPLPDDPLLLNPRVAPEPPLERLAAERFIAWRCWSKDTRLADPVDVDPRLE
jgi:hypothetical protein